MLKAQTMLRSGTLADGRARGRRRPEAPISLAAWMILRKGVAVCGPRADLLAGRWPRAGRSGIVDALFGEPGMVAATWHADRQDRTGPQAAGGPMIRAVRMLEKRR